MLHSSLPFPDQKWYGSLVSLAMIYRLMKTDEPEENLLSGNIMKSPKEKSCITHMQNLWNCAILIHNYLHLMHRFNGKFRLQIGAMVDSLHSLSPINTWL